MMYDNIIVCCYSTKLFDSAFRLSTSQPQVTTFGDQDFAEFPRRLINSNMANIAAACNHCSCHRRNRRHQNPPHSLPADRRGNPMSSPADHLFYLLRPCNIRAVAGDVCIFPFTLLPKKSIRSSDYTFHSPSCHFSFRPSHGILAYFFNHMSSLSIC